MICLIAAMDQNRVIGGDNKMLWHIPEDFRFFKATTMGKPVIMGRKTHESIGRILPGRPNIVITRQPDYTGTEGAIIAPDLEAAFEKAKQLQPDRDIMVIGGAQIYAQALPFATRVYLTLVQGVYNGEALFPALPPADWQEISREHGQDCDEVGINYDFVVYERKQ